MGCFWTKKAVTKRHVLHDVSQRWGCLSFGLRIRVVLFPWGEKGKEGEREKERKKQRETHTERELVSPRENTCVPNAWTLPFVTKTGMKNEEPVDFRLVPPCRCTGSYIAYTHLPPRRSCWQLAPDSKSATLPGPSPGRHLITAFLCTGCSSSASQHHQKPGL